MMMLTMLCYVTLPHVMYYLIIMMRYLLTYLSEHKYFQHDVVKETPLQWENLRAVRIFRLTLTHMIHFNNWHICIVI